MKVLLIALLGIDLLIILVLLKIRSYRLSKIPKHAKSNFLAEEKILWFAKDGKEMETNVTSKGWGVEVQSCDTGEWFEPSTILFSYKETGRRFNLNPHPRPWFFVVVCVVADIIVGLIFFS